jgi:hypothetical protein
VKTKGLVDFMRENFQSSTKRDFFNSIGGRPEVVGQRFAQSPAERCKTLTRVAVSHISLTKAARRRRLKENREKS